MRSGSQSFASAWDIDPATSIQGIISSGIWAVVCWQLSLFFSSSTNALSSFFTTGISSSVLPESSTRTGPLLGQLIKTVAWSSNCTSWTYREMVTHRAALLLPERTISYSLDSIKTAVSVSCRAFPSWLLPSHGILVKPLYMMILSELLLMLRRWHTSSLTF